MYYKTPAFWKASSRYHEVQKTKNWVHTHSIHGSTQQHTLHKSSRMNALEDKVVVYQIKPEKNGKRSQGAQDGKWGM